MGGHISNGPVWAGVLFSLEKSKISRFVKLENFQKMLKNQWKFYNFFEHFSGNFAIFWKCNRNFRENLGKNLENFGHMDLYVVLGAEPREASENIKKMSKNQWKTAKFRNFSWNFSEFWLEKLSLIKIKAILMEFWKALIILK